MKNNIKSIMSNLGYNTLYALSNAALIFVISYIVFFVLEGMRYEALRFLIQGTKLSQSNDHHIIYKIIDLLLGAFLSGASASYYVIEYTLILTAIKPICKIIEIIISKISKHNSINSYNINSLIFVIPYILIGVCSILFIIKSGIYNKAITFAIDDRILTNFSGYQLADTLKYINYGITFIVIYFICKKIMILNWGTKLQNPDKIVSKWFDILPLVTNVLFILVVVLIFFYPTACSRNDEYYYYTY